jgi:hypothetical protein
MAQCTLLPIRRPDGRRLDRLSIWDIDKGHGTFACTFLSCMIHPTHNDPITTDPLGSRGSFRFV